jgi:hypothetical protein
MHKVSISKWNKEFARRGHPVIERAEVYLTYDTATINFVITPTGKLVFCLYMLIAFIPAVLMYGLPIVYEETLDILFQKSRGRFGVEAVYKKNLKSWEKLQKMLK